MKLIVDIGNTFIKCAFFDANELVHQFSVPLDEALKLPEMFKNSPVPSSCFFSSVRELPEVFVKSLPPSIEVNQLSHLTPLPFRINYSTPETLGRDRIAAVAAAYRRFPDQNVLTIDMGTCITYDFLSSDGVYHGGGISPGIQLRFKAMHQFTGKLPLAPNTENPPLIGNSTIASLQSGVMHGIQAELEGIIHKYSKIYEDLTVLIGGGDNKYFDKELNYSIFAASNLVIEGLKVISDFNEYQ
jgi:type III pantothenate kinase